MDVVGELIVRPRLEAADIQSERAVIIEEIRSYLDDPSEYCQILFQTAMFGDGPLGREICGEESDIAGLPAEAIHDFWRSAYRPANTVVAVVGDLGHDEATALAAAAFGTGNGVVPGFAPAPSLPAGPRVRTGAPRHEPGPALPRACRPSIATIPTAGRWPSSTRSSATA